MLSANALTVLLRPANLRSARRAMVIAAVALATGLSACSDGTGFRPLNASQEFGGSGARERFAAVDVAPIPGRVGQRIRNELIFEASGGGNRPPPIYRLEVAIQQSVVSTRVRLDATSASQIYKVDANYRLIRLDDKAVIAEGKSASRASFERVTSIFANVRARRDAEDRAARSIAEELRTRLMAHLSRQA